MAYKIDFMWSKLILMIETSNSGRLLGKDGAGDKHTEAKQMLLTSLF